MTKVLVLTGPPGAGKGTQADLIEEQLGYKKLSTGDLLRKNIKEQTKVGKIAEEIIANGRLVSDDILAKIVKLELENSGKELILLDGYPRNLNQAETLKGFSAHPVTAAIQLHVDKDELIERLSARRICKKCGKSYHLKFSPPKNDGVCDLDGSELFLRPDDAPEKVAVRLDVYEKETKPILDFYKNEGLLKVVDGAGSTDEVFSRIKQVLGK